MLLYHLQQNFLIISRDQRLRENDQILAINHTPLDQNISHQQAIALLQQTTGSLRLVVAREPVHTKSRTSASLTDTTLPETVSYKFGKKNLILNYATDFKKYKDIQKVLFSLSYFRKDDPISKYRISILNKILYRGFCFAFSMFCLSSYLRLLFNVAGELLCYA